MNIDKENHCQDEEHKFINLKYDFISPLHNLEPNRAGN